MKKKVEVRTVLTTWSQGCNEMAFLQLENNLCLLESTSGHPTEVCRRCPKISEEDSKMFRLQTKHLLARLTFNKGIFTLTVKVKLTSSRVEIWFLRSSRNPCTHWNLYNSVRKVNEFHCSTSLCFFSSHQILTWKWRPSPLQWPASRVKPSLLYRPHLGVRSHRHTCHHPREKSFHYGRRHEDEGSRAGFEKPQVSTGVYSTGTVLL